MAVIKIKMLINFRSLRINEIPSKYINEESFIKLRQPLKDYSLSAQYIFPGYCCYKIFQVIWFEISQVLEYFFI